MLILFFTYKNIKSYHRHLTKTKMLFCVDIVEQLIENSSGRKQLHDTILRKVPDLESIAIKMCEKRAGLADFYKVYLAIKEAEEIIKVLGPMAAKSENDVLNEYFGTPFVKKVDKMANFQVVTLFKLT